MQDMPVPRMEKVISMSPLYLTHLKVKIAWAGTEWFMMRSLS